MEHRVHRLVWRFLARIFAASPAAKLGVLTAALIPLWTCPALAQSPPEAPPRPPVLLSGSTATAGQPYTPKVQTGLPFGGLVSECNGTHFYTKEGGGTIQADKVFFAPGTFDFVGKTNATWPAAGKYELLFWLRCHDAKGQAYFDRLTEFTITVTSPSCQSSAPSRTANVLAGQKGCKSRRHRRHRHRHPSKGKGQPVPQIVSPCGSPHTKARILVHLPAYAPQGIYGPATPAGLVRVSPPGRTVDFNSTAAGPINGHTGQITFCYGGPLTVTLTALPENGYLPIGWTLSGPERIPCNETGRENSESPTCTVTFSSAVIAHSPNGAETFAVPQYCSPLDLALHDPRCRSTPVIG